MVNVVSCRVCGDRRLQPFFNLGKQPLANALLKSSTEKETRYPLSLVWCGTCNLVQLNYTVKPEILFSKYFWVTGTSKAAKEFSEVFFRRLIKRTPHAKSRYVLEVASNDGTFLKPFQNSGFNVLGMDPAKNIVEMAVRSGVPTKCAFWGEKAAKRLIKEKGVAHIIFARNVIAHVANTRDFAKGLAIAIDDDGVIAIEPHYAGSIQRECQYDSIYHEHLCYFTLKPLERLLRDVGLYIFDISESPISGGAIIVYASKKKRSISPIMKKYREAESKRGVNSLASWKKFAETAEEHGKRFLQLLRVINASKGRVVGWGASARSSTLLNFSKIGPELISQIADKNSLKHALYIAGTHVRIDSPKNIMKCHPECVVILGWNFTKEITAELKNKFNYRGRILIPLPGMPKIVEI